jgi:hypothetical protein
MAEFYSCSDDEVASFRENGFLIVPQLFTAEESELLLKISKNSVAPAEDGSTPMMWLRSTYDTQDRHDMYNAIVHSKRVAETIMRLMDDEVYVYHYKMAMKEASNVAVNDQGRDNRWEFHQDYGYWYGSGALYPDFASCYIAVDEASRENGCLQVIRGSHKLGRLDHGTTRGQRAAEPERLDLAFDALERVYCELRGATYRGFRGFTWTSWASSYAAPHRVYGVF